MSLSFMRLTGQCLDQWASRVGVLNSPLQKREGNWAELTFAKTSGTLSNSRQPERDSLHFWAAILPHCCRVNRLFKSKVTQQYKFGNVKAYQKEEKRKRPHFQLKCVAQNRLCLGSFIGTFRNYNRNVKKAIGLMSKTTTLHVQHSFFVHVFAVPA